MCAFTPGKGVNEINSLLNDFYTETINNYESTKGQFRLGNNNIKRAISNAEAESSSGADYLIIVADNLYNGILPFSEWKQQKGLQTKIVKTSTLPDINSNGLDDSDIYSYIYNAFHNWDIPPVYVLLVGDVETVPTHYGLDHPCSDCSSCCYTGVDAKVATDHYYSTVNGNDYLSDLFVGRFPVKNLNELNVVVEKVINHEKNLDSDAAWQKKALLFHGLERPVWAETSAFINDILTQNGFNYIDVLDDSIVRTNQVSNAINDGRFFINYRAHGTKKSWYNVPFDNSDVLNLMNENKLPIVISPTCEAGWFDESSSDSFGEIWLKAGSTTEKKGAVAFFGSSRISYTGNNDELSKGFFKAVYNDNLNNLAQATNKAKLYMYNMYGNSFFTQLEFEMFNVIGDPEMDIIPKKIKSFTVYNDGESDLLVTSITGPSWAKFNPTSFTVPSGSSKTVTVIIDDTSLNPGTYDSTIYVYSNDPDENPISIPLAVVKSGNNPPEINPVVPDITTNENTPTNLDLTPYETDIEDSGSNLVWTISDVDTGLFTASIDAVNDVLTITPIYDASGSDQAVLTLKDSGGATDNQIITITINPAPDINPPNINIISLDYSSTDPYTIIKYNVSDKSEVANCSLIINGVVNQTDSSITKNTLQYFFLALSNGNYNCSVRCVDSSLNNNIGVSAFVNIKVNISLAGILLVDDDEGSEYEPYYQNVLASNNYTYHNWDINVLGSPSLSFLNNYKVLVWFTSYSYATSWMQGTLNENETNILKSYLDSGGKLFFSSQDYLYDYYGYGINKTSIGDFAYNYLYVDQMTHDTRTSSIIGVDGDEITHGLGTINLLFPFADYSDRITTLPSAEAIFTSNSEPTALKIDNNISKVVFFAFPFEAIELESDRKEIMQRVIQWLDVGCIPSTEQCDGIDNDCDGYVDENLTRSCGSDNCTGIQNCTNGNWSIVCSSYQKDCGICAICDEIGQCGIYDETQDIDCSQWDLPEISTCTNNPDNNPFTFDYAAPFYSECSAINNCTAGTYSYNHSCGIIECEAECEVDGSCSPTECDYLDGCYQEGYRDYKDAANICLENCSCTKNICDNYTFLSTDIDGDSYDTECDNDCNDSNPFINPSAVELCNGIDDNCNGLIDEDEKCFQNYKVYSPLTNNYSDDKVPINISLVRQVPYLKYIDYGDSRPSNITLCTKCMEYGYNKSKTITLDDGYHNITIFSTDGLINQIIPLFVDATAPKVSDQEPNNKDYCNGRFNVRYTEYYPINFKLHYGTDLIEKQDCPPGRNQECEFNVSLGKYENKTITFYFEVQDTFNTIPYKRSHTCLVDTIPPNFTNLEWSNQSSYLYLNISLDEKTRYLKYIDYGKTRPRESTLCSNCDQYGATRIQKKSFSRGNHNVVIIAEDAAGNRGYSQNIIFTV